MGTEDVARICADSAETIHTTAQQFSNPPSSGLGPEIDALVRRNHAATTARLDAAEATLCEMAAEAMVQHLEGNGGPAPS